MGPGKLRIELGIEGADRRIALFTPTGHEERIGTFLNGSLACHDVAYSCRQMALKGVVFEEPPEKQPWGTFAKFHDPTAIVSCSRAVRNSLWKAQPYRVADAPLAPTILPRSADVRAARSAQPPPASSHPSWSGVIAGHADHPDRQRSQPAPSGAAVSAPPSASCDPSPAASPPIECPAAWAGSAPSTARTDHWSALPTVTPRRNGGRARERRVGCADTGTYRAPAVSSRME